MPTQFDLRVFPATRLEGELQAQPSKNYTTRYLLAAALSQGQTQVRGVADSEDARALITCLRQWGASIDLTGSDALVTGFGACPRPGQTLDVGNAGAVARFLLGICPLTANTTITTPFPDSLGQRPQDDLLAALRALGAQVTGAQHLPVTVSGPVRGGKVEVEASRSSQFVSALLWLAPLLPLGLELHLTGEIKSEGPIRQTLHTLATFGIQAQATPDLRQIRVAGGQSYQATEVRVPGDYPGSAALLVAGATLPGVVSIRGLQPDDLQGERAALEVLRDMGANLTQTGDCVTVRGGAALQAVVRDGDAFTDAVQVLCAAANAAQGQTTWHNVATLRLKECDRISETRRELLRLGIEATETADSLSIVGQTELVGGIVADGHGDHRMIMLLVLLGLRARRPIVITGAHHLRKSYPDFLADMTRLGAHFEVLPTAKNRA